MTQAERESVQGLMISVAGSRTSKSWKPREYTWEGLAARLDGMAKAYEDVFGKHA